MSGRIVGPFVGHYHDRTYCGVCSHCRRPLILLASLCETCDEPTVAWMWGES